MKSALLLVVAIVIVGAAYFFKPSKPAETASDSTSSQTASGTSEPDGKPVIPRPTRAPESTFSANADIAQLKAWLKEGNHGQLEGLLAKMVMDLKAHPELVHELLEGLKTETDPRLLPMLSRVILEGGAIADPAVAETALALAKSDSVEPRRHAGLFLLGEVPNVTPEMTDTVAAVSREARETLVRTSALATMADWMEDHADKKPALAEEMLKTIKGSDTLEVRANGLLFLVNNLTQLPENFTTEVMDFLDDSSHYNRMTAARGLSKMSQQRAVIVPKIEAALRAEKVEEARRSMLGSLVAATGTGARPYLQQFANDPSLAQDVRDYVGILDAGVIDAREIAERKDQIDVARNPIVVEKH